jgi:5'-nucleotidase / UDP-sugar diphosphatase
MGNQMQPYTGRDTVTRLKYLSVALLFLLACSANTDVEKTGLTFIHLNDTYRIGAVEGGSRGGFARVVTIVKELQQQGRDVHILHGGDFLYPSLESQLWNGMQMVDALNFMDDIAPLHAVVGNHETDRRTGEHMINAVRASRFDWLGDNYDFRTGADDVDTALKTAFVFEHAERKVGIFALTLHHEDGGNERAYVPVDINHMAAARHTISEFEAQGVDLMVGLTHLHLWQDAEIATLKAEYPKLLFIAGGHEHEPEFLAPSATSAAVVKGASNARSIWRVDIDFDDNGLPAMVATEIELDSHVAQDAAYAELAQRWRDKLLEKFPFLTARIGEAALPMDGREAAIRNVETGWGNFVVDQMRTAFDNKPADLAFINSGTLRIDDVIAGDITFEDIGRTFGFSSYLRYLSVTGEEFQTLLEAGYRGEGPSKGHFPQISGFRVCVDRSRAEFDRIVRLQVPTNEGWQQINADTNYELVVSDFIYGGGDGYDIPKEPPASKTGSELKYLVLDAIMLAQTAGQQVGAAVDPANPRIVILEGPDAECFPGPN